MDGIFGAQSEKYGDLQPHPCLPFLFPITNLNEYELRETIRFDLISRGAESGVQTNGK